MATLDLAYGREVLAQIQDEDPLQNQLQEMELLLQNSSYGHESLILELGQSRSLLEREVLSDRLEDCRQAYFEARDYLARHFPERLRFLEESLVEQKALQSRGLSKAEAGLFS